MLDLARPGVLRSMLPPMDRFRRFDEAYYHRFYEDLKTRVVSSEEHAALGEFVFAFARWNKVELKSVLDIGAGIGLWKRWIEKNYPEIKYTGTEVSHAMCKKYGFLHRDIKCREFFASYFAGTVYRGTSLIFSIPFRFG